MEPYNPKTITGASRTPLPEMPQSAPAHQGYFMPRHSTHPPSVVARTLPDYSHSLPPTPMMAVTPREDSPSHDQFRSLQASYEQLKRNMQAVNYENDNLKRELSFARKRMEETDALRKERDTLDQSLKDVQTNIDAALDRVRVSRNNEQAALNKATAMAARLDEANMQKVDVLENHLELQQQMSAMEKKIAELKGTVKTLDARPEQSMLDEVEATLRKSEERNKFLMEQVHAIAGRTDLPNVVADLAFKLEDMQKTLKEKEYRIEELEEQNNAKNNVMTELEQQRAESIDMTKRLDLLNASHHRLVADQEKSVAKVHDLEHRVTEKEQSNRILQAERDQFRQLLYADLRRSANEVHNRKHPNTNMLDRKMNLEAAIDEVRARAQHYMDKQTDLHLLGAKVANPAQRARELEEEVEYHVKDIVLYKLDVKGYKKDLKRAQAKIQQLTEQNPHSKASSFSIREGRPSVSSQSSTSTVPQVTFGGDGEPTTLRIAEIRTNGLGAQAYTPSGSPMGSPGISPSKEKRFFSEI
ncbi:hypothetical protein EJ08DRAFT_269688 [Tothia fuscella]|uniref:Uncharacterized protein n=1 Tax=Tothia fuscella TaxID=1048955 RepID=A0A9P4NQQ2_9PEZI|nr:hypothetical protein EJ08DRAFT_269688 [Tothia fuscella]